MVVTVTRGGYIKRTRSDNYRSQHRGGRGVRGAQLRADDIVDHFFVTTTHHWLLFFTNKGRVYRAKAYEVQEARPRREGPARRQPARHAARRADRRSARHPRLQRRASTWCWPPVAAWSRRRRSPSTTPTAPAASSRSASARAMSWSRRCSSTRTPTSCWSPARACRSDSRRPTSTMRPMGRSTSGVIGMHFRGDDQLLGASVIGADTSRPTSSS